MLGLTGSEMELTWRGNAASGAGRLARRMLMLPAILGLGCASVALAQEEQRATFTCPPEPKESRTVTRVIDGDTLQLDGGAEVRLIGALAPRAFDAAGATADWPLEAMAREGLEQILTDRNVKLAFAGRRSDRHGRLLAHVVRSDGAQQIWLQAEMLKRGLARAYALEGSVACLAELISHEASARQRGAGLWADAAYSVRPADDTTTLVRFAGTFQIVEGTVAAVSDVRGTTYINFGEDWRQDFTIILRPAARRAQPTAQLISAELGGRRIRVRGWIERRGGPMIEISHPAAIEVLAVDAAETAPRRRRSRSR